MAEFNPNVPSIARVYDYFLDGKDNFAADRALAEQQLGFSPLIRVMARENRQFLARATAWVAGQGVDQFLDLGCGMPTVPNTHESVRAVIPGARVAYVDNDPVVVAHLNALVANGDPGLVAVDGNVLAVREILDAAVKVIDLGRPACAVFGYLLHFLSPQAARDLVAEYVAALAPGSYVVISAFQAIRSEESQESIGSYSNAVAQVYNHSTEDFTSFFGPLALVSPGVAEARLWPTPDGGTMSFPPRDGTVIAGVARR